MQLSFHYTANVMAGDETLKSDPVYSTFRKLQSQTSGLEPLYHTIDQLCSSWSGKKREEMHIDSLEIHSHIDGILKTFNRYHNTVERVALSLLSFIRCRQKNTPSNENTQAYDADSSDANIVKSVAVKAVELEQIHLTAIYQKLGEDDPLDSFMQWIGVFGHYLHPQIEINSVEAIREAMHYLTEQYDSAADDITRLAFLVLGMKELCIFSGEK